MGLVEHPGGLLLADGAVRVLLHLLQRAVLAEVVPAQSHHRVREVLPTYVASEGQGFVQLHRIILFLLVVTSRIPLFLRILEVKKRFFHLLLLFKLFLLPLLL